MFSYVFLIYGVLFNFIFPLEICFDYFHKPSLIGIHVSSFSGDYFANPSDCRVQLARSNSVTEWATAGLTPSRPKNESAG